MPLYGKKKNQYQVEWISKRRNQWIEDNGGRCMVCGSNEFLEIDHINREEKKYAIAQIWSRNIEIRESELAKCQILCKSCHKKKTAIEFKKTIVHGSYRLGYKKNCRCSECIDSVAPYWREYRLKKKLQK